MRTKEYCPQCKEKYKCVLRDTKTGVNCFGLFGDACRRVIPPTPCNGRSNREVVGVPDLGSSTSSSSDAEPGAGTCTVLKRRLRKAITANIKWQQKYTVETRVSKQERVGVLCVWDPFVLGSVTAISAPLGCCGRFGDLIPRSVYSRTEKKKLFKWAFHFF